MEKKDIKINRNEKGKIMEGSELWKFNEYAKGFKTPEDLQAGINKYWAYCEKGLTTLIYNKRNGKKVEVNESIPYTTEGLCNVLGISRMSLLNYQKKKGYEQYFKIIEKAKMKIQQNKLERGLMNRSNPIVSIFDLKNNHGYNDQQTITHERKVIDVSKNLSNKDIEEEEEELF